MKKRKEKSERTRQRILHSAARIFRQFGYAAASLRYIAQDADLQAGSLYHHFESKDELAEAVMTAGIDGAHAAALAAVNALDPDANPLEKIEAAFTGHLSYLLAESDFTVALLRMLQQTPDGIRQRILRRQRKYGRFLADLFDAARTSGLVRHEFDLSALRMLMMGAMNWAPEWYDDSGLSPQDLARQLCMLMEKGVLPENVNLARARRTPLQRHTV